jgi:deoxyribose-phosphate aldolase
MTALHRYIDYTNLKPDATFADMEILCKTAVAQGYYAVCVPPVYVKACRGLLSATDVKIASVVGFPTGYSPAKLAEVQYLIEHQADEVDVVMNIALFKSGKNEEWFAELMPIRTLTREKGLIFKLIMETALLSEAEIATVCELCTRLHPDFVKTATGYIQPGAQPETIRLLRRLLPNTIRLKASGGIRTSEQALNLIQAGADRIGTSAVLS